MSASEKAKSQIFSCVYESIKHHVPTDVCMFLSRDRKIFGRMCWLLWKREPDLKEKKAYFSWNVLLFSFIEILSYYVVISLYIHILFLIKHYGDFVYACFK